jgi:predicted nucleic acid-binding protein
MPFILDSSMALAWVLPDERSAAPIDQLADKLATDRAIVPAIWPFEIFNALLTATRRARISSNDLHSLLGELARLPVEIEHVTMTGRPEAIGSLAARHGLTSYDAAYVELAKLIRLRHDLAIGPLPALYDKPLRRRSGRLYVYNAIWLTS